MWEQAAPATPPVETGWYPRGCDLIDRSKEAQIHAAPPGRPRRARPPGRTFSGPFKDWHTEALRGQSDQSETNGRCPDSNPGWLEPAGEPGSGPAAPAAISTFGPRSAPAPALLLPPPRSHLRPSLRSAPAQPRARLRSCRGSGPPSPPRPAPATAAAAAAAILAPRRLNNNFIDKRNHGAGPQGRTGRLRGGAGWGRGHCWNSGGVGLRGRG